MTSLAAPSGPRLSLARDEALAFAERAEAAQDLINNLHREPAPDRRLIARAHGELGLCIKLAEVHAILAVADAVDVLYIGLSAERES